jgi:hypothetical protein
MAHGSRVSFDFIAVMQRSFVAGRMSSVSRSIGDELCELLDLVRGSCDCYVTFDSSNSRQRSDVQANVMAAMRLIHTSSIRLIHTDSRFLVLKALLRSVLLTSYKFHTTDRRLSAQDEAGRIEAGITWLNGLIESRKKKYGLMPHVQTETQFRYLNVSLKGLLQFVTYSIASGLSVKAVFKQFVRLFFGDDVSVVVSFTNHVKLICAQHKVANNDLLDAIKLELDVFKRLVTTCYEALFGSTAAPTTSMVIENLELLRREIVSCARMDRRKLLSKIDLSLIGCIKDGDVIDDSSSVAEYAFSVRINPPKRFRVFKNEPDAALGAKLFLNKLKTVVDEAVSVANANPTNALDATRGLSGAITAAFKDEPVPHDSSHQIPKRPKTSR